MYTQALERKEGITLYINPSNAALLPRTHQVDEVEAREQRGRQADVLHYGEPRVVAGVDGVGGGAVDGFVGSVFRSVDTQGVCGCMYEFDLCVRGGATRRRRHRRVRVWVGVYAQT